MLCAVQDTRARLDMAAKSLEIKHPAFHGLIDAQCAVSGCAPAATLSGDLRVSRGSVIASGTFPQVLLLCFGLFCSGVQVLAVAGVVL